jgi:hypothetical protein
LLGIRRGIANLDGVVVTLDERRICCPTLRAGDAASRGRAWPVAVRQQDGARGAIDSLFDAVLNYLWDETVNELRRRVIG